MCLVPEFLFYLRHTYICIFKHFKMFHDIYKQKILLKHLLLLQVNSKEMTIKIRKGNSFPQLKMKDNIISWTNTIIITPEDIPTVIKDYPFHFWGSVS